MRRARPRPAPPPRPRPRSGDARDHPGRAPRGPGADGGGHRAHRDVAVHPREERLLRGHPRRARPRGVRHDGAALRQPHARSSSSSTRRRRCVPATSTGTTTATARTAASLTRRTWSSPPRCSTAAGSWPSRRRGATSGTSAASAPGSISPDATEIFHEGIIVPAIRIYREGVLNDEAFRIFLRNSRFPDILRRATSGRCWPAAGWASGACSSCSSASVPRPCWRRGRSSSSSAATPSARRWSRRIPDGTYESEDAVDGDGMSGRPFHVRMRLDQGGRPDQSRHARRATTRRGGRSTSSCTTACPS